MQWEGQQLQDGNRWLHYSLVSVWGVFPGLALKNTWANLRLQISGASANALINIGVSAAGRVLLWDWGYSGSLWVSSRRVGDLSSFCCSLRFHAGGAHSLQEVTGGLAAFLRGGGLWFHLLIRFSQKSLFCLSPPLHLLTDNLKRVTLLTPPPYGTGTTDV